MEAKIKMEGRKEGTNKRNMANGEEVQQTTL
jgi:hypothetical protein